MPKVNPDLTITQVRASHAAISKKSNLLHRDEINRRRRERYAISVGKAPAAYVEPIENIPDNVIMARPEPTLQPETRVADRIIPSRAPIYDADEILRMFTTFDINAGTATMYKTQLKVLQNGLGLENGLLSVVRPGIRERMEGLLKKNNQPFSDNSKKAATQALVWFLSKLGLDEQADIEGRKELHEYFNELKIRSGDLTKTKQNTQLVPYWADYLEHTADKFGKESKEYLIASIYYEVPVRDDFKNILFQTAKTDDPNQVIIPGSGHGRVFVSDFKTAGKYDPIDMILSVGLTTMIRNYITANKIGVGQKLFKGQLSKIVGDMNKRMGYVGSTGVTMYRQMHAPIRGEVVDARTRMSKARDMKHSVEAQEKYIRGRLPIGHWKPPRATPKAKKAPAKKKAK